MLLTAQRVRSADGRVGVNAFRFRHGSHAARVDWADLKPEKAEEIFGLPASLDAELVEIAPGGNEVLAFVDVAGPDDVTPAAVIQAMGSLGGLTGVISRSVIVHFKRAASAPRDTDEKIALTHKLLSVLRLPPIPEWRQRAPLQLVMAPWPVSKSWLLQLTDESAARIRERLGNGWAKPIVELTESVVAELKSLDAAALGHALSEAGGIPPELALELGGIELHQQERVLRRWPEVTRAGFGRCPQCGALNALTKPEGKVGLLCRFCGTEMKSALQWEF